jgi:outer membrane lipase/esterase
MRAIWAFLFAGTLFCSPAHSQNYNQVIAFGDSTIDTGWFAHANTGNAAFDAVVQAAIAQGGNAHSTGPGPGNAQILAAFFGLTANAANTPGGTNLSVSGAFDSSFFGFTNIEQIVGGFSTPNSQLPSATQQITNYLASVNGHANPKALYMFSTGGNDVFIAGNAANPTSFLLSEAQSLANSIAALQAAGARYIIVSNEYSAPLVLNPSQTGFGQTLLGNGPGSTWSDLAALGVKFIPADTASVIAAVVKNPAQFGITDTVNPACVLPPSLAAFGPAGYGAICAPVTSSTTTGFLVSANALQTHLFMDFVHLTEAGQQIVADYEYSLLTAPSEISFLAETAVKARLGLVSSIQNQIELSESHRGPSGINAWVTGDVTSLSLQNYHGFPGDPDTVITGAAGVDYAIRPGLIAGLALSEGSLTSALGTFGTFKQQETSASLYAAYKAGPLWANVIGTYGHLNYDVNRNVPIGISIQSNTGSASGDNWSAAFQGGYKFWNGAFTHGPIAGFIYQNVKIGAFTETGSFTSLGFGSQTRESDVGQLGYRASYNWAEYQPFVQAIWNHEFADTNRNITASLTTISAPSFSLPAVILGKDWGEVKAGVTIDAGRGVKIMAVGSVDFAQSNANVYGGQIGFNIAF